MCHVHKHLSCFHAPKFVSQEDVFSKCLRWRAVVGKVEVDEGGRHVALPSLATPACHADCRAVSACAEGEMQYSNANGE